MLSAPTRGQQSGTLSVGFPQSTFRKPPPVPPPPPPLPSSSGLLSLDQSPLSDSSPLRRQGAAEQHSRTLATDSAQVYCSGYLVISSFSCFLPQSKVWMTVLTPCVPNKLAPGPGCRPAFALLTAGRSSSKAPATQELWMDYHVNQNKLFDVLQITKKIQFSFLSLWYCAVC